MRLADFALLPDVGEADLRLWARTAERGEAAAYPARPDGLAAARALFVEQLVTLTTRRPAPGAEAQHLMVRR